MKNQREQVKELRELRDYVVSQFRDAEAAIAKDAASEKFKPSRASKRVRQILYTKGASCAYDDVLRRINVAIAVLDPGERL